MVVIIEEAAKVINGAQADIIRAVIGDHVMAPLT